MSVYLLYHAEVNVVWWRLRTSNPSKGGNVLGEFDSHTPPPYFHVMTEEIIICFENVTGAIMAEQILAGNKFSVRVMPTPSSIKAGCGFCLRLEPKDLESAAAFLSQRGLPVKEAYLRGTAEGRNSYEKINLFN